MDFPPPSAAAPVPGMRLRVRHLTRFHYDGPVLDSFNDARLCPVSDPLQRCSTFDLRLDPQVPVHTHHDFYLNRVDHFELHQPHETLEIESNSIVETRPDTRGLPPSGLTLDSLHGPGVNENYFDFLAESKFISQNVTIWREAVDVIGQSVSDLWADSLRLGQHVHSMFAYDPDWTHVHTNAAEAIKDRRGVCQDYAHVMIALCRSQGIPARYVSGYFYNGKTGTENEASHAWMEVFLPGYGWKAWDPTHGREADARYIKLAIGRDYDDAKPVSGRFRGKGKQHMDVHVQIRLAD
ncbi:transglutaminase-like putative cysteine protease [Prosthecobacter fusiformis]|uniref:Transglutaminase-like putative cysteine protease n=1 Tax=Prosthecobacter fusiformis TaxID=48464 RepID=A0A4R7SP32_9BACT|nr:transglutaminase family protein [Prosthecobacter fusiformis]TDU80731.1 transglutaminase-like putative cysteine protease [Prosthecobacter fusiformis]